MGAAIHHSQRRVSCEACRNAKARCQRIRPTDSQCARCFLLKIECIVGKQRKVGRPRLPTSGRPTHCEQHNNFANEVVLWTRETGVVENSKHSSDTLTPSYYNDQASLLSPESSFADSLSVFSSEASSWQETIPDEGASSTWDTSWELDLASLTSGGNASSHRYRFLSHPPSVVDLSPWSREVASPRYPNIQHPSHTDSLSQLQRISLDLHVRAVAVEHHKQALTLDMISYKLGPLYKDGFTLAQSVLKSSQDFLVILARLHSSRSGAVSSSIPPPALNFADLGLPVLLPRPCITYQPLSGPLALTIINVFTQLIALYELIIEKLSARVNRSDVLPIPPIPISAFEGSMMVHPCKQGLLFTRMAVPLLERMESVLGTAGGPENWEGLLSPRQLDVLWIELGGVNGETDVGMLRPIRLRKAFHDAEIILRRVLS
ncbi:hypothetical protein IWW34DRAFT_737678 [Fusarium oxysporum f. sp. albedinis]|nr:hypothetical protein IWW34DRAFT_737678 [Fusarium oxysporum f. sp. albedinis]KAJ0155415.1 hypothetical protein HZ326_2310 [Fusarium oxysporum f. sp. albedinis]